MQQSIGYLNPVLYQLDARAFNDTVPVTFGTGAGVTTLNSNQLDNSPYTNADVGRIRPDHRTSSPNVPAFVARHCGPVFPRRSGVESVPLGAKNVAWRQYKWDGLTWRC